MPHRLPHYQANAYCPNCGRPPAQRYYQAAVDWARSADPEEPWADVVCTKPGCGTMYLVSAWSLQTATLDIRVRARILDAARRKP